MTPRGTSRRIADELRDRVRDNMGPGGLLPSEAELAQQYGVARGTVRVALSTLVGEGLIEVVPGVGRRIVGEAPDRTTAYGRIVTEFTEQIRAGMLGQGSPLPSEAKVMQQYGVSRNTVRRAYKVLADAGVVETRHGVGTFVRVPVR
ncbi:GntR family transcriptional regulator [Pseudonocardia alni]|uniref:GntR family transcriptional regulator n=1 Tax=Pseudonocardia alni TaxID=33907 RepID=UPI00399D5026